MTIREQIEQEVKSEFKKRPVDWERMLKRVNEKLEGFKKKKVENGQEIH